jgi:hypothetical protein
MRKRDKRDPKELWDELVEEAGEDEIEKAASMSVAQAEAELRAAGVDVDAERARARALLAELAGQDKSGPAGPKPGHEKSNVRPFPRWMAAAGVVAAAAGAALVLAKMTGDSGGVTHRAPSDEDLAKAADLRRRAAAALTERRAKECLSLLDEARDKDPVGDSAPDMRKLREDALRALGRAPPR